MSSNSKLIAETQLGGHSDQTGALDIPAGTTAQRPSSPSAGYIRMNTTLNNDKTKLMNQLNEYNEKMIIFKLRMRKRLCLFKIN